MRLGTSSPPEHPVNQSTSCGVLRQHFWIRSCVVTLAIEYVSLNYFIKKKDWPAEGHGCDLGVFFSPCSLWGKSGCAYSWLTRLKCTVSLFVDLSFQSDLDGRVCHSRSAPLRSLAAFSIQIWPAISVQKPLWVHYIAAQSVSQMRSFSLKLPDT